MIKQKETLQIHRFIINKQHAHDGFMGSGSIFTYYFIPQKSTIDVESVGPVPLPKVLPKPVPAPSPKQIEKDKCVVGITCVCSKTLSDFPLYCLAHRNPKIHGLYEINISCTMYDQKTTAESQSPSHGKHGTILWQTYQKNNSKKRS